MNIGEKVQHASSYLKQRLARYSVFGDRPLPPESFSSYGSPHPLKEALGICRQMAKYALACGLVVNLLMLASPLYSMQVLDRVLSSGSQDTLVMILYHFQKILIDL